MSITHSGKIDAVELLNKISDIAGDEHHEWSTRAFYSDEYHEGFHC